MLTGATLARTDFYGNQVVTYTYDANGNRTILDDAPGASSYVYDVLNRLTIYQRAGSTTQQITYGYDLAGNVTTRTYLDGTIETLTQDNDGRLATVAGAGLTTTYSYDAAGNVLTALTPDGFTARSTYDRAGRLAEIAHVGAAGVLSRFTYALDRAGNRLTMTTTRGTMAYTYDRLDRLTRVDYSGATGSGGGGGTTQSVTAGAGLDCLGCGGGTAITGPPSDNPPAPADTFAAWTYDPVGNRLSETTYLGTTTYTYDAADRLVSTTGPGTASTPYTYDPNGNELTAGPNRFTYDLADRLVSASVGNTTETYTWAGDGIRRSAATGSQATKTTQFLVDRAFPLPTTVAEHTGNGALLRRYTYGLDLLSQTTSTKGPYWYHHDGLGSVTDITSASGSSLWWTEYTPFGAPRASASTSQAPVNLVRFSGAYLDLASGLYHLRARQYDPSLGRFLSVDPLSPPIAKPCVSTYTYARNNPVRFVDPSGLESQAATASPNGYSVLECLSGLLGFYGFGIAGLAQVAGGGLLLGFSVTLFGVTFGGATPVTAGGVVAGLGLEVSGFATEVAAATLVYKTRLSQ